MASSLRAFLRLLPCRPLERQRTRAEVVAYLREQPPTPALSRELTFHLQAQAHLRELNLRYFPQSGLTEREIIAKTAERVGFKAPEWDYADTTAPPGVAR